MNEHRQSHTFRWWAPGFEPRTCGLRVRSGGAGQRAGDPLTFGSMSQHNPSFPHVSRYMTGGRREDARAERCHGIAERSTGTRRVSTLRVFSGSIPLPAAISESSSPPADSLLQPFSSFLDVSRSFAGRMRDERRPAQRPPVEDASRDLDPSNSLKLAARPLSHVMSVTPARVSTLRAWSRPSL